MMSDERGQLSIDSALFERDLARKIQRRLESENAELREELQRVSARLEERERRLADIEASRGWRLILQIRHVRERIARR